MPIVFDTETTGLYRPDATELYLQPYITEIYMLKFDKDYNIVDEFETFFKPPVPIPEIVQKITNINDAMVANAPTFIEKYDHLCEFFRGETVSIAHNASFDHEMLQTELRRHDLHFKFPWCSRQICTVEVTECIENKRLKLERLHEIATGKPTIEGAHRAKTDVMALFECVKWLREKNFI